MMSLINKSADSPLPNYSIIKQPERFPKSDGHPKSINEPEPAITHDSTQMLNIDNFISDT